MWGMNIVEQLLLAHSTECDYEWTASDRQNAAKEVTRLSGEIMDQIEAEECTESLLNDIDAIREEIASLQESHDSWSLHVTRTRVLSWIALATAIASLVLGLVV